jgi:TolA-binding protein
LTLSLPVLQHRGVAYRDDQEALHAQVEALESELREERSRRGKLEQELERERQQQKHEQQQHEQQQHEQQQHEQQPSKEKKPPRRAASPRANRRKRKPQPPVKRGVAVDGLLARLPYRGTLIASLVVGVLAVLLGVVAVLELKGGSRVWVADAAGAAGYAVALVLTLIKPWSWASGGIAAFVVGIGMMGADLTVAESGWRAFIGIAGAIAVLPLLAWDDR